MSKPNAKNPLPDFSGQSKIMIVNEGSQTALLMIRKGRQRNVGRMVMPTAGAALAWCRKNGVLMVYLPVNLTLN
jgi:hypothetical protein